MVVFPDVLPCVCRRVLRLNYSSLARLVSHRMRPLAIRASPVYVNGWYWRSVFDLLRRRNTSRFHAGYEATKIWEGGCYKAEAEFYGYER